MTRTATPISQRRSRASSESTAWTEARTALAKRLVDLLLKKGWSQSDLARRAGVGRDVVNKYVNGRALPTPANAKALADALGVEVVALLHGPSAQPPVKVNPKEETPPVAMRSLGDGRAHLQIDMVVPFDLAIQILGLLPRAD